LLFSVLPNNTIAAQPLALARSPSLLCYSPNLSRSPLSIVSRIYRRSQIWLSQGPICKPLLGPPLDAHHLHAPGPPYLSLCSATLRKVRILFGFIAYSLFPSYCLFHLGLLLRSPPIFICLFPCNTCPIIEHKKEKRKSRRVSL
jgi:hypothetical protein